MLKTLAAVHAPGADNTQLPIMVKKLNSFVERLGLYPQKIDVNHVSVNDMTGTRPDNEPLTLIIGWGLSEKPCWSKWAYEVKTSPVIKQFVAVDLYERCGAHGRVLTVPYVKSGHFWWHKSWQTNCKLFLRGCYISTFAPYGMKRIPKNDVCGNDITVINRYKLGLGPPEEVDIVRLVFSLFVDFGYTLTEISNLLNAEGVKAPHNSKIWNGRKLKSLVESAVYIGSNQFGACLKHDVFPALIDRSTFCAAQAKIYKKEASALVLT